MSYILLLTQYSSLPQAQKQNKLWSKQIFQTAFLVILGISLRLILSIVHAVLAAV